jgi:pyrroloquinoline quinone biosynthesis protein B
LGGSFPDYVSETLRKSLPEDEAVIGLQFMQRDKRFLYAPSLPGHGEEWKRRFGESQLALLDGTFWADDELIKIQCGTATARQMGHLPLFGPSGLIQQLQFIRNVRRVLIHINNTNPILDEESPQHRAALEAGFEIAYDGMELEP